MQRHLVGVLALILLAAGLLVLYGAGDEASRQNLGAGCLRMGAVLAVLWLALPDVARPASRWVVLGLVIAVFFLARNPKAIVLVLVFLAALALLRPRLWAYAARR
jgi:hypothetical protein